MLIVHTNGRLGNQLFLVSQLNNIVDNEKVFLLNFGTEINQFLPNNFINILIKNKFLQKIINLILVKVLRTNLFCKIDNISTAKELVKKNKVSVVVDEYFIFDHEVSIKDLKLHVDTDLKNKICAVHMRFGDYKDFKVFGLSAMLPKEYYHDAINYMLKNHNVDIIEVFSDDKLQAKEYLKDLTNVYVKFVDGSLIDDFLRMRAARFMVCSASTLSWWAAKDSNKEYIICPKYWAGFNSKIEYPPNIIPNSFHQIEVDKCTSQ